MSIRSRATRYLTPRRMLVTTALTVVATFGLVIAAPGSNAFAAGPTSPQERVASSLEHGHLVDDLRAGRITDADIDAVGTTGLDVFGQHIDKWEGLSPAEEAAQAKAAADGALRASGLDYTIVRPGGLTDEPGTGLVTVAERLDRGQIPRADVAAVLLACLTTPATIGRSFDLLRGETPIATAFRG